jgi:hypothetical protein
MDKCDPVSIAAFVCSVGAFGLLITAFCSGSITAYALYALACFLITLILACAD